MGITIVLSHSHCTRIALESHSLLITPLSHPPTVSSVAVYLSPCSDTPAVQAWWSSPASHRAKRTRVNECPLPESLLLSPDQPAVHSNQSGAWAPATEEISYLFILAGSSCNVSNQTQCILLQRATLPLCCSAGRGLIVQEVVISALVHFFSWKRLLDQNLFKYFALFTVASGCAASCGVDEQLDSCPPPPLLTLPFPCILDTWERPLVNVVFVVRKRRCFQLISKWPQLREWSRWF
ncbi:hypothetical protein INR49_029777 [Caranx melampygus]|nr:hypothetical protein INR49_029777 [Caranx melampygus]